jgi:branched-chain amino acid transport system substrate-binding protein
MILGRFARAAPGVLAAALLLAPNGLLAGEAGKTIKIGVVYDLTGPFAGGGSELQYLGAKIMIDWFNEHGGIDGYKVEPVYADAQSKPDVAINEAVRLIEQEKVDMLLGFYSSAECVPTAARVEQFKKFMWITTCIASPVLEGRNLQYVFRPQPFGRQWGLTSTEMVAEYSKAQLGKDPKDLRVAIIHEDGAYGTDVGKGNVEGSKKYGFQICPRRGLLGERPRPLVAGHQAEARPTGCDLSHRLQPGHHPVPAPGARTRPALLGPRRPGRRLWGLFKAEGDRR